MLFRLGIATPDFRKTLFFHMFLYVFEVWGSRNLLKNDRGTKLAFKCFSDSVSGRLLDDSRVPKRSKNAPEFNFLDLRISDVSQKLCDSPQIIQRQRESESFAYLLGSAYDQDCLICFLSP